MCKFSYISCCFECKIFHSSFFLTRNSLKNYFIKSGISTSKRNTNKSWFFFNEGLCVHAKYYQNWHFVKINQIQFKLWLLDQYTFQITWRFEYSVFTCSCEMHQFKLCYRLPVDIGPPHKIAQFLKFLVKSSFITCC